MIYKTELSDCRWPWVDSVFSNAYIYYIYIQNLNNVDSHIGLLGYDEPSDQSENVILIGRRGFHHVFITLLHIQYISCIIKSILSLYINVQVFLVPKMKLAHLSISQWELLIDNYVNNSIHILYTLCYKSFLNNQKFSITNFKEFVLYYTNISIKFIQSIHVYATCVFYFQTLKFLILDTKILILKWIKKL